MSRATCWFSFSTSTPFKRRPRLAINVIKCAQSIAVDEPKYVGSFIVKPLASTSFIQAEVTFSIYRFGFANQSTESPKITQFNL